MPTDPAASLCQWLPNPLADINLKRITRLAETFSVPVGLSDHTLGNTAAQLAIALGAVAIEKHLTLARADGGPDAEFSLEPRELKELCSQANSAGKRWAQEKVVTTRLNRQTSDFAVLCILLPTFLRAYHHKAGTHPTDPARLWFAT